MSAFVKLYFAGPLFTVVGPIDLLPEGAREHHHVARLDGHMQRGRATPSRASVFSSFGAIVSSTPMSTC
jgi:hypothetical protein